MAQRNENEMYSISNDDDAILSTENNTENAAEPSIDTEQCGENLRGEDAEESELLSVVLPSSSRPPPGVTGGDIVDTAAGKSTDFSLIQKQQSVSAPINDAELPDSVIGAPEVLKPAIRKKQNKASARRSRSKKLVMMKQLEKGIMNFKVMCRNLEHRLDAVETFLTRLQCVDPQHPAFVAAERSLSVEPDNAATPSEANGISTSGYVGSSSSSLGVAGILEQSSSSGVDGDNDVDQLIAKCLGQL